MDMLDTIRNDAAATEAAGRLAPSTVAALVDAGSFKLWVPENYGGAGASLQTGLNAIAEIARADGAAPLVRNDCQHDRAPGCAS